MEEIVPAATLILLRDTQGSRPQILMVQRGEQLAFAGGAMVFPGGRIDDGDAVIAGDRTLTVAGPELDPLDAAGRVAAIRETIEEVGIAPAVLGLTNPAMIADIRKRLADHRSLGDTLREFDLRLDLYQLHPFARWLPKAHLTRVFDTRFYIACSPDHDDAVADGSESSACHWDTAAGHLALAEAGTRTIIFPTLRNLERAGLAESFADAVDFVARYPIDIVSPTPEDRDGEKWLRIPDHLGYPVTCVPMPDARRYLKA